MKNLKIVKNYIVRDPSTIIVEGSDYKTKSFTSEIKWNIENIVLNKLLKRGEKTFPFLFIFLF